MGRKPRKRQVPPDSEAGSSKKPKATRQGKLRSWVWAHYDREKDEEGNLRAICRHCKVSLAADTYNHGTSGCINHLEICKEYLPNIERNQALLALMKNGNDGKGVLVNWKFSQELVEKALTKMVVIDELSFSFVEGEGFKQFIAVCCPNFRIPSRHTIARKCVALYDEEFVMMKAFFKNSCQRVCLTTDTWTSNQKINYMVVTAHFVDNDWKLHKRIISFLPILSHKGEAISFALEKCVRKWELDEKVFTITLDNASSNDSAMSNFKEKMKNWNFSISKGEFAHVRCIAHILNLVVSDGLKVFDESIEKVRNLVRYVRQSPARLHKFKECVKLAKIEYKRFLCLDVPTRWNSTYLMLFIAAIYELAFARLEELDPSFKYDFEDLVLVPKKDALGNVVYGPDGMQQQEMKRVDLRPSTKDWERCRQFARLLKHFYELTLRISGSLYVTSNNILQEIYGVYSILLEWESSEDYTMKKMGTEMRKKFDKYWGNPEKMNPLLYISMVLDPRFKLEIVEFMLCKMHGDDVGLRAGKKLKSTLYRLFDEYKAQKNPQAESGNSQLQNEVVPVDEMVQNPSPSELLVAEFMKVRAQSGGVSGSDVGSELDKYLKEAREESKTLDVLDWWKQNSHSHRFPILSCMARDVLAIPVSTVASESAFSTSGRVLGGFRSSLTPKLVETLVCAQDWLRASKLPMHIDGELEEFEKIEEEMAKLAVAVDDQAEAPIET